MISADWVDPDDAPELGSDWCDQADVKVAVKIVGRGGRPSGSNKEQVSLRLDKAVLGLRAGGPGWQTRINDALRRAG